MVMLMRNTIHHQKKTTRNMSKKLQKKTQKKVEKNLTRRSALVILISDTSQDSHRELYMRIIYSFITCFFPQYITDTLLYIICCISFVVYYGKKVSYICCYILVRYHTNTRIMRRIYIICRIVLCLEVVYMHYRCIYMKKNKNRRYYVVYVCIYNVYMYFAKKVYKQISFYPNACVIRYGIIYLEIRKRYVLLSRR